MNSEHFKDIWDILNRQDLPKNAVCSHHGVYFLSGDTSVKISNQGNYTLVTMYDEMWQFDPVTGNHGPTRLGRDVHEARVEMVRVALTELLAKFIFSPETSVPLVREVKVLQTWNGDENHSGVSVVYDIPLPQHFKEALDAYRSAADVFAPGLCSSFYDWYKSHLPEWYAQERDVHKAKQADHRWKHDSFEKLRQLQNLGFHDIIDAVVPFLNQDVANALLSKR